MNLHENILRCKVCHAFLPAGPRPVVQLSSKSKIIIIGQAPGKRVHETGIPWNDASGRTLRQWLNVNEATFYNNENFSIVPMSFCYPGKGKSGDLPPRKECAPLWHADIFNLFEQTPLVLLIGIYAQAYYLKGNSSGNLTDTVKNYKSSMPDFIPLPHPSPRNRNWLKVNPWFTDTVIPHLQAALRKRLQLTTV